MQSKNKYGKVLSQNYNASFNALLLPVKIFKRGFYLKQK